MAYSDWYEATAKPSLVVRNSPDVLAEKIGSIPYGGKVDVLEKMQKSEFINGKSGNWAKIQWENSTGYVFDSFLTQATKSVSNNTKNLTIASNDVGDSSTTIKADSPSKETDDSEQTKSIIVTGYGTDHDQALKNALQSAVEQQIGVLIDSETVIKNDELIKNEILTASNGFVKKYDELSTSTNNGLTEVKIKADVKSQAVAQKITSLNIATLKTEGVSNVYAEAKSKEKAKVDSQAMLDNTMNEILSKQSYTELLEVSLNDYNVLTDKTEGGKTPVKVNYKISFNYPAYEEKIKKLEATLSGIGATLKTKTDYPTLKKYEKGNSLYSVYQDSFDLIKSEAANDLIENSINIIKKNGGKYIRDTWILPDNIKNNHKELPYDINNNTINIEITDKQDNILDAKKPPLRSYRFYPADGGRDHRGYEIRGTQNTKYDIFIPFLNSYGDNGSDYGVFTEKNIEETMTLDTEDLKNFDKIQVSYQ